MKGFMDQHHHASPCCRRSVLLSMVPSINALLRIWLVAKRKEVAWLEHEQCEIPLFARDILSCSCRNAGQVLQPDRR